ncbi:SCO2322 family protein [Streptomyces sp. NPDC006997]|uniref:SCO2322 family protein n=1 Tax=Streptomyces sp. NPDC006997 TaxID=3155356 RepID=UPI00340CF35A
MTPRRRAAALSALVLAALLTALAGAVPAQAAGYRYWSFWEREDGRWTYATQGPSQVRPSDGAVHGFRFAVSEDSADADRPRGGADFTAICGTTPERGDRKRIALVLDFGTRADAPSGEAPPARRAVCASVPTDASTAEALAAVAKPLRYDTNALLCAIAGYPRRGCGEQISTAGKGGGATETEETEETDEGPSLGLLAGGAVVAVLAAAAVWQVRRRG